VQVTLVTEPEVVQANDAEVAELELAGVVVKVTDRRARATLAWVAGFLT
jgi:hypothetical protein